MLLNSYKGWVGICILVLLFGTQITMAQSYGLHFSGHEVTLDQRTQLYLTPDNPIDFSSQLELSFKLKMAPEDDSYFGYIFRMVLGDKNIDLIHGFLPERSDNFQLVVSDQQEETSFGIPLSVLTSDWLEFHFTIDINKQVLTCNVMDLEVENSLENYSSKEGFRLFFGAHTFGHYTTTDVCQMNIRDVKIVCDDNKTYNWPLNNQEGDDVLEINHKANGHVVNPNWLVKMHNEWKNIGTFKIPGFVKTTSNIRDGLLYIASSNSMHILDISNQSMTNQTFSQEYKLLSTNHLMFDTLENELISYSQKSNYTHHYDLNSKSWSDYPSGTPPVTSYWHHNKSFTPEGDIYLFGGYGEHLYRNHVQKWNAVTDQFDTINTSGEFYPRYLAGGGYNPNDSLYYILGGYGSKTGIQTNNPDYYYEILQYSFEDSSFRRFHTFEESENGFCFAGSIAIDESSNIYGLRFAKHIFDNQLQLVKIPHENPEIIELGSPIAFDFFDVKSTAELYYFNRLQKMVAVSTYMDNDTTRVNVHSISFPPQKYTEPATIASSKTGMPIILIASSVLIVLVILIGFFIYKRRKQNTARGNKQSISPIVPNKTGKIHVAREISKNSIILFGGFQVIDKDGNDITGSFTPLLKKLFLFILLNSLKHNKGVSSNLLYETFWFDKSIDSARNNRAVNIVKLKSLLEKVGVSTITKDTGYWKFEMEQGSLYIDYLEYLNTVGKQKTLSKEELLNLLAIIERGALLRNIDADWLDVFKSEVSNMIIDTLAAYINNSGDDSDPDFIMQLTNCMFMFDMVSEEAMYSQCKTLVNLGKHSLAKKAYAKFVKEYKLLYNEEYDKSFSSIIGINESQD